jgi:NTE family protein
VSFALQGGGAHGAFTWGVLDRFLESGVRIDAVSGTSAGACNAVLLAHGWREDGPEGARRTLAAFWRELARKVGRNGLPTGELTAYALGVTSYFFSPYELNPLDVDPLRELLEELVDFEALRRRPPFKLLIAATNLRTGQGRLFDERELTVETVLASSALPTLRHAVEIEGEPYWDGGFTSNPPLVVLADRSRARDIVLVRINPVDSPSTPTTASDIRNRVAELVFSRPLAAELQQLESDPARSRVRLHVIDGDSVIANLHPTTRLLPQASVLEELREAGYERADGFIAGTVDPRSGSVTAPANRRWRAA